MRHQSFCGGGGARARGDDWIRAHYVLLSPAANLRPLRSAEEGAAAEISLVGWRQQARRRHARVCHSLRPWASSYPTWGRIELTSTPRYVRQKQTGGWIGKLRARVDEAVAWGRPRHLPSWPDAKNLILVQDAPAGTLPGHGVCYHPSAGSRLAHPPNGAVL